MDRVLGGITSILLEGRGVGLHGAVEEHSKVLVQVSKELAVGLSVTCFN
jgi:hypothetical protein